MIGTTNIPYVSCIKINGIPILPPLVTPKLRKELLKYKHQAIKLEQRLKNCQELKRNLDELLEIQNNSRPSSQLTFGDNSHIEALNIFDKSRDLTKCNLSRDIIEVTQYDDSGMKTICSNITLSPNRDSSGKNNKFCDSDKTDQYKSNEIEGAKSINEPTIVGSEEKDIQCFNIEIHKPTTPPKPRLIRSNSYTLESPSPILLAHLQKNSQEIKNTDFNSLASGRNWASLENNHTSFDGSDFSSVDTEADTVYHNENCSRKSSNCKVSSPDKSAKIINEVKSPTIEVYQTDISVQQITVNTSTIAESGLIQEEKSKTFFTKNPFDVFEPDCELLSVLKDIPKTYANQIIELLRIQHVEQKERLERYDNLSGYPEKLFSNPEVFRSQNSDEKIENGSQESFSGHSTLVTPSMRMTSTRDNPIDFVSKSNGNSVTPVKDPDKPNRPVTTESCANFDKPCCEKLTRSSTFSMSPSQSLYYSITSDTDSLTVPSSSSVKLIDSESNKEEELEVGVLREKNGYWEGVMIHENAKNLNCNRELFPDIDPVTMKEWAASVIGAYVKGYLTRRLLKTEKVQSLIATVKDVLMCAVELHHSDNIDEKDVELHRRLINQLSAALYSFHDTFFDLSIPEQMLIIAADRQRKLEKLKRPQSGKSLSRPVSGKSKSSSKSNKSLPSSRSSSKHKLISGSPSLTIV